MKRFYPNALPAFQYEPSPKDFQIVQIGDSVGEGVMAQSYFYQGDIVCAFCGYLVTDITQFSLRFGTGLHVHDPYFMGKVLHSCDPNLHCDMSRRLFIAKKDIVPGELITMDYAQTEDYLFKPFPCSCGSANCRGFIVGRLEKAPKRFAYRSLEKEVCVD